MSWNVNLVAQNKETAKKAVAQQQKNNAPYFPESIRDTISSLIDALPDKPVKIESNGNVDSHWGYAEIRVGNTELALAEIPDNEKEDLPTPSEDPIKGTVDEGGVPDSGASQQATNSEGSAASDASTSDAPAASSDQSAPEN